MKPGFGWARDPVFHLIALVTVLGALALALTSHPALGYRSPRIEHPRGCHACSQCRPEVAAARDAYLIRTGSIEPVENGE